MFIWNAKIRCREVTCMSSLPRPYPALLLWGTPLHYCRDNLENAGQRAPCLQEGGRLPMSTSSTRQHHPSQHCPYHEPQILGPRTGKIKFETMFCSTWCTYMYALYPSQSHIPRITDKSENNNESNKLPQCYWLTSCFGQDFQRLHIYMNWPLFFLGVKSSWKRWKRQGVHFGVELAAGLEFTLE